VYYLLFPLLLVFIRKRIFWIGLVGVLCLFIYFTYFKLSANETIADQWVTYTNPLNNLLYFVAGVGLASIKKISLPVPMLSGILVVSVGLLVMLPLPPEFSNLIFGTSRLLLSTSCIVLCFVLYSLEGKPAEIIHKPLSLLGKISYSVYLLHPLTWGVSGWAVHLVLNGFGIETVNFWHLPTAFALTLILSVFSYYYLEKSCIRLGNKLATLYTEQQ
jgi:peptidoglycan/LPS O-acetylase OafA/YrhL